MRRRLFLGLLLGLFALLAASMIAARDGESTQQTKTKGEQATKPGAAPDRERDKEAIRRSSRDFNLVFETGVDNLTKDETAVLVHFGKDKTQQWMLVRVQ